MKLLTRLVPLLCVCFAALAPHHVQAQALQTFTVGDHIGHDWSEELLNFSFDVATTSSIRLTDGAGNSVPAQFSGVTVANGRTKGNIATVVNQLPAGGSATFQVRTGTPLASSDLGWLNDTINNQFVFWNDRMAIRIPRFPGGGTLPSPVPLTSLPTPILGVRNSGGGATAAGTWMTGGSWFNNGTQLMVKATIVNAFEVGPVRHRFRVVYVFTDDTAYAFDIYLGSKQDAATIIESCSSPTPPDAGWRLSMQPGLNANHVFFQDQNGGSDLMKDVTASFSQENVIAKLRPWTFWWNVNMANWAGFYQGSNSNFFGVFMRKPSLWAPSGDEAKYVATEIPITARTTGAIDLTLRLQGNLVRHWGLTAKATTSGYVQPPGWVSGTPAETPVVSKLRLMLAKYSEFPLDEVKDFNFDFSWSHAARPKPFLIMNATDLSRVRGQFNANQPVVKQQVTWSKNYSDSVSPYAYYQSQYQANGREAASKAFFDNKYELNDLRSKLVEVYIGSNDAQYEELLAAAVRAMGKYYLRIFFEAPVRASIGANAHTMNAYLVPVLLNLDAIHDSPHLTAAEKTRARNIALFLAHLSSHPDYWNPPKGLTTGNPNMELLAMVPRGLFGLYFAGHPKAAGWVAEAKARADFQLADLTAPAANGLKAGAWYESPGYQLVAFSDVLLFATALRKVNGDSSYFQNATLKDAVLYAASLVTPPDVRFPLNNRIYDMQTQYMTGVNAPSIMPSLGDSGSGQIYPEFGLMAAQTATLDPAFSAQLQHVWKLGNHQINTMPLSRGAGFMLALTDVSLGSTPGALASGYSKFGAVMRSSWTDPRASYVCHRTSGHERVAGGNNTAAHWQDEEGSLVYYAKGAPLSLDPGDPSARNAWQHSGVSFERSGPTIGMKGGGDLQDALTSLPSTLDYSRGRSEGVGGQVSERHLLMVKSANAMGANYLVIRDKTIDGQPNQPFYFNLWSPADAVQVTGSSAVFTGPTFSSAHPPVDLQLHVLSPAGATLQTDLQSWSGWVNPWGPFGEQQRGVYVAKTGSSQDFFTVLYPRAQGQTSSTATLLGSGRAVRVTHQEGTDWVLLSPGASTGVTDGLVALNGEVAFARSNTATNTFRMAVSRGGGSAAYGALQVTSTGPTAIEVSGASVSGETSGSARNVSVRNQSGWNVSVRVDGVVVAHTFSASGGTVTYTFAVPAGEHKFTLAP